MKITRTMSDVADIGLALTDASATISTSGSNAMTFAGLVISRKGKPNCVLNIDAFWQNVLGKPFHMREGAHAESSRHVHEATQGGNGKVVRVMPSDAKFPVITVTKGSSNTVATSALAYGTEVPMASDGVVSIYLTDGDNDTERKIEMVKAETAEYGEGFFLLRLKEKQADGEFLTREEHVVSGNIEALDPDGNPAFIEDKLSNASPSMDAVVNLANINSLAAIDEKAFQGGTSGDYSSIDTAAYNKALAVLQATEQTFTAVCSLGCYDDNVLKGLEQLAFNNNVGLFYDIEPNLNFADAVARQRSLAMNSHFASAYHLPYSAKDPFFKGKSSYGLSGFAFAAKAKAVASKSPVGAYHLTAAGEQYGTITRSGLEQHEGAGVPDYPEMYKVRLNKLGKNSIGQLMIDDSLTTRAMKDQLRFEGIVATDNAIGRAWLALAKRVKHSATNDAAAAIRRGLTDILDDYVTSGCLVKPRNPEDGDQPFVIRIEPIESDGLKVTWDICISGTMRRAIGQPRLFK